MLRQSGRQARRTGQVFALLVVVVPNGKDASSAEADVRLPGDMWRRSWRPSAAICCTGRRGRRDRRSGRTRRHPRLGGDDICGYLGDDVLLAGTGRDRLIGGVGQGGVFGGPGASVLLGGTGRDALVRSQGDDVVLGRRWNDAVDLDRGHEVVHGGAGPDLLQATGYGRRRELREVREQKAGFRVSKRWPPCGDLLRRSDGGVGGWPPETGGR
jgi:RTX calcium-binding nonapeptide repeat (4 copies)